MADLSLIFDKTFEHFDLGIENWELQSDDGLETAILISLFTDARAESEELPPGEESRRGFWADVVDNPDQHITGSKFWLLDRAKSTSETLEQAREYCLDSLQWLVDDGIAETLEVENSYLDHFSMLIAIVITRPTGERVNLKYNYVWEARGSGISATFT